MRPMDLPVRLKYAYLAGRYSCHRERFMELARRATDPARRRALVASARECNWDVLRTLRAAQ